MNDIRSITTEMGPHSDTTELNVNILEAIPREPLIYS